MKVLWIVNMVLPKVAKNLGINTSVSGGWLIDLLDGLSVKEDLDIGVMTYYSGKEYKEIILDKVTYFLFPGGGKRLLHNSKKTRKDCQKVLNMFNPDLIHIHGTEYAPGYEMLKCNPNVPTLLTIQGILKRIAEEYYGGLSLKEMIKSSSIQDWIKLKTPIIYRFLYCKNAKRERKVLHKVKYVTGRTDWDKSTLLSINPELTYFRCNYNLRPIFYSYPKWNITDIEPYTIFAGASHYSLKGLHVLIEAIEIVKRKYPNVRVYIPGGQLKNGKLLVNKGYMKMMVNKIKSKGLDKNIVFLGPIKAEEVAERLSKANVCVVTSAIEGASATICEAMMIGTPSICAYRGGMTELLTDYVNGFTYDFIEHPMLAHRIIEIFENDDLAIKFSKKSIELAEIRHDREKNIQDMLNVYNYIQKNN